MTRKPRNISTPCEDTPENRDVLIEGMRATSALYAGENAKHGPISHILVAHNGKLDFTIAGDCKPDIMVVAEYSARDGAVTVLNKLHRDLVWVYRDGSRALVSRPEEPPKPKYFCALCQDTGRCEDSRVGVMFCTVCPMGRHLADEDLRRV